MGEGVTLMYLFIDCSIYRLLNPSSLFHQTRTYLRSPCDDDDADIQAKSSGALHSLRFSVTFIFSFAYFSFFLLSFQLN